MAGVDFVLIVSISVHTQSVLSWITVATLGVHRRCCDGMRADRIAIGCDVDMRIGSGFEPTRRVQQTTLVREIDSMWLAGAWFA
jgi:hypothetical protein